MGGEPNAPQVVEEVATHRAEWRLEKYRADEEGEPEETPYESLDLGDNLMVNAGLNLMTNLLCGAGGTVFNNANSYLGVGDSSTAAAASQTDLQAATNKLRKAMDATFPTSGSSQQVVFKSTFATGDANFAWQEGAVFNASSAGTMLNRKVSSMGTKTSAEVWVLTCTITFS